MAGLAEMHDRFLRFLRGRVGDPATAEDILQTAYVKAIQHGGELREAESSVAWFYRILRNALTDYYRHNAARSRAMDQVFANWKEDHEPELQAETCACIQEVIRDLKPEYRAAIEHVDLAGESVESFARAWSTTPTMRPYDSIGPGRQLRRNLRQCAARVPRTSVSIALVSPRFFRHCLPDTTTRCVCLAVSSTLLDPRNVYVFGVYASLCFTACSNRRIGLGARRVTTAPARPGDPSTVAVRLQSIKARL